MSIILNRALIYILYNIEDNIFFISLVFDLYDKINYCFFFILNKMKLLQKILIAFYCQYKLVTL